MDWLETRSVRTALNPRRCLSSRQYDASRIGAQASRPSDSRHPTELQHDVSTPTRGVVTPAGAGHIRSGTPMIKAPSCALPHERPPTRFRSVDGRHRPAAALRLFMIGVVSVFTCACGGGGSGGGPDAPVVTAPPPQAELAWDNGNWDQQEWK